MYLSNDERVGKAIRLLAEGLAPFVDRECRAKFGDDWPVAVQRMETRGGPRPGPPRKVNPGDAKFLLKVMWDEWRTIFGKKLSRSDRNYVSELRDVRNAWAHNEPFSTDDALRALDTAKRLLESVSAGVQANEVGKLHQDLLRQKSEHRPDASRKVEAVQPDTGLPARQEVATRYDDMTTDPVPHEFFCRTYLVQVNPKGYETIINDRYYENLKWKQKNKKGNEDHGMVEPGDQLVLYCTSTVPNETHKKRLAFSVTASSVSDNRTTFKLGEPQFFQSPLKLMDIRKYVEQGKLDKRFDYCGKQWFNITELKPTSVKQLFDLVVCSV